MHNRNPITRQFQRWLIGGRALVLGAVLAAALSLPVVPRANGFTLIEWLVVLSAIRNVHGPLCVAATPDPQLVDALKSSTFLVSQVTLVFGTPTPTRSSAPMARTSSTGLAETMSSRDWAGMTSSVAARAMTSSSGVRAPIS